jgi:Fe-S-cluster containining protein
VICGYIDMMRDNSRHGTTSEEQALAELERQVERGSLFTHTIMSQNTDQIHEVETFLYGVIDALIEKGIVTQDEVLQSASRVRQEMEEKGQAIGPGLALRIEENGVERDGFAPVNCSERLPICRAACCKLSFVLTAEEAESGRVKWDLGKPYYVRQESTGYCHHLDMNDKVCSVYENRPGCCRRYSCARDERIWKDFDKVILNEEWITEHLQDGSRPRLITAQMLPQNAVLTNSRVD